MATHNLEATQQRRFFNYSTTQFIMIVFLIYYLNNFLGRLNGYCVLSGLPRGSLPPFPRSLTYLLRHFFIYHLAPLMLFITIIPKHFSLKLPNFHLREASTFILLVSLAFVVVSMVQKGVASHFVFIGYLSPNLTMLVYFTLGLYLLYVFRNEAFSETIFGVVIGVLLVGELWELPLNWVARGNMHPYVFLTGYLQRYIPFFFWFYIFRNVYLSFLRKQWFLVPPFICAIAFLTMSIIEMSLPMIVINFAVNCLLHLSYALLLVFLPFQFYIKGLKRK